MGKLDSASMGMDATGHLSYFLTLPLVLSSNVFLFSLRLSRTIFNSDGSVTRNRQNWMVLIWKVCSSPSLNVTQLIKDDRRIVLGMASIGSLQRKKYLWKQSFFKWLVSFKIGKHLLFCLASWNGAPYGSSCAKSLKIMIELCQFLCRLVVLWKKFLHRNYFFTSSILTMKTNNWFFFKQWPYYLKPVNFIVQCAVNTVHLLIVFTYFL